MARNPKGGVFRGRSKVEVRSDDGGPPGAWVEATVATFHARHRRYSVVTSSGVPKVVNFHSIRPRPPRPDPNLVFGLHQPVEVFFRGEGWRMGVVTALPGGGKGLYSVCFPATGEEVRVEASKMRREMEWVEGEWVEVEKDQEEHSDSEIHRGFRQASYQPGKCSSYSVSEKLIELGKPSVNPTSPLKVANVSDGNEHSKFVSNVKRTPPFTKMSTMWEFLESTEVFCKMPQQPHFCQLEELREDVREGAAIGLMVTFTDLVAKIPKVQISDSKCTSDLLQTLQHLESNGFSVKLLRDRLEKLLQLQGSISQYDVRRASLKRKITEGEDEEDQLEAMISVHDNIISRLEENLRHQRERRASLLVNKSEKQSEIVRWRTDLRKAEETYLSDVNLFDAALRAPW